MLCAASCGKKLNGFFNPIAAAFVANRRFAMKHIIATALFGAFAFYGVAAAQSPKASIVITSEPLRGNKADVEINGKKVASVGPDDPYRTMVDPGKVVVTTKGGRVEIDAQPNKEYVFEIVLKGSTGGFMLFGLAGSSAMADYPITLQSTRDLP